jgi:hypothetical protein
MTASDWKYDIQEITYQFSDDTTLSVCKAIMWNDKEDRQYEKDCVDFDTAKQWLVKKFESIGVK